MKGLIRFLEWVHCPEVLAFVVVNGAGKDPEALSAKAKADPAWGAKMYEDIDKLRRGKDKSKTAEILAEIEKK